MGQDSISSNPHNPDQQSVRIDKWLWAARFYKTRGLASKAIDAGHVRINHQRCKPSREVKPGDLVHIERAPESHEIRIVAVSVFRGPAVVAQTLYLETDDSRIQRQALADLRKVEFAAGTLAGRPTKRDRRMIQRLKDGSGDRST